MAIERQPRDYRDVPQEHWAVSVSFNIGITLVLIVILLIIAAHFGIGPWVNP